MLVPGPEDAAGLAAPPAATAAPEELAGAVRARLVDGGVDPVDGVWVVDAGALVGRVPIGALLRAPAGAPLAALSAPPPPPVDAGLDQERVALHALANGLDVVPVVRDGKFVGVIPARRLLVVLRREHVEDLHRMAGMLRESEDVAHSLEDPPTRQAAHRLPWLLVGLAGSVASAVLVGRFEPVLEKRITAAFFVPAIVYLADAVGTQTETLVIRGLSHVHLPLVRIALRELGTGMLLGLVLGLVGGPVVAMLWRDAGLGLVVGLGTFAACSVATVLGLVFPWALSAAGGDPALGSGPVATIVQDLVSLLVYLSFVAWLL